ncbi:dihydrofolate reductase family protein [Mycobacterium yunnanensis]|uniref:Dihydrofolate reductase family protein n=2 Tax=Mycobacterium yunnanensis TaxID=368477 RepID=A0A9X2Z3A1_9MYCO|nr:dihydrofolate reductase family protein [Mycobacterium yunnanensis]
MQGPGSVDEDTRDGFAAGGWATPYADPVIGAKMGERMGPEFEWLFGRRTYEQLLAAWNSRGGPFKDALNGTHKHVVSGHPATTLPWPNSHLLHGDVTAAVAALRERDDNLVIMGSGVLVDSLAKAGLVDEYVVTIAPVVLGEGRRLFGPGVRQPLRLLDCTPVGSGAVVVTYAA